MISLAIACLLALPAPGPGMGRGTPAWVEEETQAVCPVCGGQIEKDKGTKVLVRGREYTVDAPRCAEALAADPDQYLNADGTPKNAKKASVVRASVTYTF